MVIYKFVNASWLQRVWWTPNLIWSLIMLRFKKCSQANLEMIFLYLVAQDHRMSTSQPVNKELRAAMHTSIDAMFTALYVGKSIDIKPDEFNHRNFTPRKMSKESVLALQNFILSVFSTRGV